MHINVTQGSAEWMAARAGVVTASMFGTARDKLKSGLPSAAARSYAFRLAMERVCGTPLDDGIETPAMRRGKELEPKARERHSSVIGMPVEPCGFFRSDNFGSSPDGLIGNDGCAEYKCLINPDRIGKVLMQDDLSEFMDQIQGHMLIADREWCDFCIYLPQLAASKRDLFRKRVFRDNTYITPMLSDLMAFDTLVEQNKAMLLTKLSVTEAASTEPF